MGAKPMDVMQGTLELLILKALSRGEALHGFGLLSWLREATAGELAVEEGALYPALHRMERRGWLTGKWGISEKGRRAKYYSITSGGRAELRREEARWNRYIRVWDMIAVAATKS